MTDRSEKKTDKAAKRSETGPVSENPTKEELEASLKSAKFSQASQMAKEAFGENPKD